MVESTISGDEVKKVAVLAYGGGIGPFASSAGSGQRSGEPHIETAAWRVVNIARQPITPAAPAIGKIVAAYGFGMARKLARQFGGLR